jgi:hypothetical protein
VAQQGRKSARRQFIDAMNELFPPHLFRDLKAHGHTTWTPRRLVWVSVIMNLLPGKTLTERFSAARRLVKFIQPRWTVPGTYSGFVAAQLKWWPVLWPLLKMALRPDDSFAASWRILGWLVFAVDGTRIESPRTMANEAGLGCAGKEKTCPQVFQTTLQHVGTGLPWDLRLGPGTDSERTHLREMLEGLPPQSLLTADAGFMSYDLASWLCSHGHPFVMRVGGNITLLERLGWEVSGDAEIVYLWPQDKRHLPPVVLRTVKFPSRGGLPVVLLTNVLDPEKLTDAAAREIYSLRWEIELYYRTLKQTWGFNLLESRKPETTLNEQWWRVISLWSLQKLTAVRLQSRGRNPRQFSGAGVRREIREFLDELVQGHPGRSLDERLARAVKDNFSRKGPKQTRRWPRKKHETPPQPPIQRAAKISEVQKAKRLGAIMLLLS